MGVNMRVIRRFIVRKVASLIPFDLGIYMARFFLVSQGIGFATDVEDSGELRVIKRLIKNENPVIFDVGGNLGLWSENILNMFQGAQVHVFEPSEAHFIKLSTRLNNFGERCILNMFGLSEETQILNLNKNEEITGSATFIDSSKLDTEIFTISERAELKTGSEYLNQNGISMIDYLKIDVEGWEFPVLRGLEVFIANSAIEFIQFEITPNTLMRGESFWDFYDYFVSHGYRVAVIKPNGALKYIVGNEEILNCFYPTNFLASRDKISS
jgi:FkbM family methyltransferase